MTCFHTALLLFSFSTSCGGGGRWSDSAIVVKVNEQRRWLPGKHVICPERSGGGGGGQTHGLACARPDKIMSRTRKNKHRICEPFTRSVDPCLLFDKRSVSVAGFYTNFSTSSTGATKFLSWSHQHMIWSHPHSFLVKHDDDLACCFNLHFVWSKDWQWLEIWYL